MKKWKHFIVFSEICHKFTQQAQTLDPTIKPYKPTHLLMLLYVTSRDMNHHIDDGENDGDDDFPIVSFCLGNSCDFAMKFDGFKGEETIFKLRSGDDLLFGYISIKHLSLS